MDGRSTYLVLTEVYNTLQDHSFPRFNGDQLLMTKYKHKDRFSFINDQQNRHT